MTKKLALLLVLFGFIASFANAQTEDEGTTSHVRILFHGRQKVEHGWGAAGWLVAGNITDNPDQWMGIAGPRYNGDNWWIEVMGGAIIKKGSKTPLIDIRYSPPAFTKKLSSWWNVEWVKPGDANKFYLYGELNYALPGGLTASIETENTFDPKGKDSIAVGPHLVVPLGDQLKLVGVYHFHRNDHNRIWVRAVFNF